MSCSLIKQKKWALQRGKTLCRRKDDDTYWIASSPQNAGQALGGLFSGKSNWFFVRARFYNGYWYASPKIFWHFHEWGQFNIIYKVSVRFLPAWPAKVEYDLIEQDGRKPD